MIHVYVIAPDKASGFAFCDVMIKKGIDAEFNFHKIAPRVIGNKITKSKDVLNDINNIFASFRDKTKSVVIACNTLQLWLKDVSLEHKKNVKIYTTFEACNWKFKKLKNKPLWLGTTPLVERTKNFPTLISLGRPEVQEMVQELIWRVKMFYGDDCNTAPESVKKDVGNKELQKIKIKTIKEEILISLKELGIKHVITGCTELPMVYDKPKIDGINFYDPADCLADYIKSQSVVIVFAGGTISSLANSKGVRQGGKTFDLLEKLAEKMPGSYKNLNISKSGVVYSGFSENMMPKDYLKILTVVNKNLDDGVKSIVITHGTDGMEQTAKFLQNKLEKKLRRLNSVIILTGSNDHAGSPKTDAWDNLRFSITSTQKNLKPAVYIAFAKRVVEAKNAVKEKYNGKNMRYISKEDYCYRHFEPKIKGLIYDVSVVRKNHDEFIKKINKIKPKEVYFKLYHSGTANTTDPKASVAKLIKNLTKKGITCYGFTENGEPTDLDLYPSSVELKKSGMIPLNL